MLIGNASLIKRAFSTDWLVSPACAGAATCRRMSTVPIRLQWTACIGLASKKLAQAASVIVLAIFATVSAPAMSDGGPLQVSVVEKQAGEVSLKIDVPNWSKKENPQFSLTLDNDKEPILATAVSRLDDTLLSVVVCIDKSGSMKKPAFDAVKQGLQEFLQASHPKLDVSMIAFGSGTKAVVGFGTDTAQQLTSVQQIQLEGPDSKTALYEAIYGAILQLNAIKTPGAKRIIVITDGEDEGSAIQLEQVVRKATDAGIAVDAISTGPSAKKGLAALRTLSTGTHGALVEVDTGTSVGPALEDLISRARATGGTFQALFKYKPARDTVDSATVTLVAAGGQPANQTIQGPFVRVDSGGTGTVPVPPVPTDGTKPWWWHTKVQIGLSLAGLAVALLLWLVLRPRALPAETVPPVLPPVQGPPPTRPVQGRSTVIIDYTFPPPGPGGPAAVLKGCSGPIGTLVVPIDKPLFRIGAGENNDLRLVNDDFLSNDHASIRYESGSLYLADRGSRNGTFLNGTRLANAPMPLSIGDRIRFARSEVIVEPASAPQAPQAQGARGEGSVL